MITNLFYKEWIKTRIYSLVSLCLILGFTGYSILSINRLITLKGAEHLWEVMILKDAIFIDLIRFIPLLIGILFAIVQFAPEMYHKCLKLTLHLPLSQKKMTIAMTTFGCVILIVEFLLSFIMLKVFFSQHFATEISRHIMMTTVIWYLAGIIGYIFTAWICLEPTWKRKIANSILAALVLKILFISDVPESYNPFLPIIGIFTLLSLSLPWQSIIRFKEGKQD